ncbi:helix-turn-helix transcriptional regulator [Nocardiopsis mangrovi]|uniref:Helix-turn-helix transcriptional regulator n=1 Tax=Nocardiopsis mangrovi TaxID=1179818 RepID=A0ABV9E3L1_9ACTN
MTDPPLPTWDEWRDRLKQLRDSSGMTQRHVAHSAGLGKSTVNALETGRATPKRTHAVALDEALSEVGELTSLWESVSGRGNRIPEWWAKPLELEKRAMKILEYDPCIVPGLLQSDDYAHAMLGLKETDPEVVEKNVRMRLARLGSLRAEVSTILAERALLSHPPGRSDIVPGQLDHILGLVERGRVRLQILPDASIPLNAHSSFRIATISPRQGVAYCESYLGGLTKGSAERLTEMTALFERLASESLPVQMSMDWIRKRRTEWNGTPAPTVARTTTTASRS